MIADLWLCQFATGGDLLKYVRNRRRLAEPCAKDGGSCGEVEVQRVWSIHSTFQEVGVSKNSGTPKSSILIGFSIINHLFSGFPPIFGNTQVEQLNGILNPTGRFENRDVNESPQSFFQDLFKQLLEGLEHIHKKMVVHRDCLFDPKKGQRSKEVSDAVTY